MRCKTVLDRQWPLNELADANFRFLAILSSLWAGLLLNAAVASASIAGQNIVVLGKPPFQERILPAVDKAGAELWGYIADDPNTSTETATLTISGIRNIGRSPDTLICVDIIRASGLYHAHFEWKNDRRSSTVTFRFKKSELAKLGAMSGELAVLARARQGSTTCRDAGPVLPAAWGLPPSSWRMALLINTLDNDRSSVSSGSGSLEDCRDIDDWVRGHPSKTEFNSVCPLSKLPKCGAEEQFQIVSSQRTGDANQPQFVRLRGPC